MMLDLTNEETDALARLLSRTIDDDRYPLSPRIQILEGIFVKIGLEPPREPLPSRGITSHSARLRQDDGALGANA